MVHASVRAVGPVHGGPDEIHHAVLDAMAPSGTRTWGKAPSVRMDAQAFIAHAIPIMQRQAAQREAVL